MNRVDATRLFFPAPLFFLALAVLLHLACTCFTWLESRCGINRLCTVEMLLLPGGGVQFPLFHRGISA
jgi:hypothetical protein